MPAILDAVDGDVWKFKEPRSNPCNIRTNVVLIGVGTHEVV